MVSAAALVLPFTPLLLWTYREAQVTIVEKSDGISVDYNPTSGKLQLTFQVTASNSGNKDGTFTIESAKLTNIGSDTDFIPFDSSDTQLADSKGHTANNIVIPKGDTTMVVTCILDYQMGDIGRRVLSMPSTKTLTVRFNSAPTPLVVKYHLDGWPRELLNSTSNFHRTIYDR